MNIVEKRWTFTRNELKKFQKWYSKQNKKTQDKIQEIINYYNLSFEGLNKTISKTEKERLKRKIEEWISLGIYTGYFKYRVEELTKGSISYRSLIEILLYGVYMEEQQIISNEVNEIYSDIALDCYNQGKEDLKQEKVNKMPKIILETLYRTLIDGIIFFDYLNALYLTNMQEIQKQYLVSIQQNKILDVYSDFMQRQFEKQRNRLISVNDDKFSGGLDKYAAALGNLAYIEAGGNDNQKVKLVSDHCDNETEMCSYLDGMIFNTKDRNIFERPMGKSVKELAMQQVDIVGLVIGINQPPISEHFHWCHSTLTFQIDKSADELRNNFKNIESELINNDDLFIDEEKFYYKDVTQEWLDNATPNSHDIIFDKTFVDDDGVEHPILGLEIAKVPEKESNEYKVANILENIYGREIRLQPRIETAKGCKEKISVSTPDYKWDGIKWDLKTPGVTGEWKNAVERFFKNPKKAQKQARKYIIDFKNFPEKSDEEIIILAKQTLQNKHRDFIEDMILLKGDKIIKIYSKK